ncbi:alpha/beta hydrolase [Gordonia desulfuricans]|uniref:Alpha/beta hydrolase n=1 Tax=Gordonia desulfuricans TaxID=89051 RepID=A0A7K3LWF4_9ACTN|nr:alpha/beta fold hydrolase [Gordonia desulfuricans]NDK92610.1 alpha/beta hydrolase [Gordonia desulfuricans]
MPYFDGAQGRVFYRHWPAATTPTAALIFLHGFGEHSGLYHRYAAELASHGVELWALDQPGHGLSEGERGNVGSCDAVVHNARVLTDLAAAHRPDVPLAIGGHSLGSLGAVFAALDRPGRYTSVVVSGAPLSPLPWLQAAVDSDDPFELDLDALSADPFYRDELANDPLAFTAADIGGELSRLFTPAWERLDRDLPASTIPLLAVHGRNDAVAPLDGVTAWQDRLPTLRVEVVADGAHDVLNEVAHAHVAAVIGRHIGDHVPSAVSS